MLSQKLRKATLWTQGAYTFLTAIWPIVDIESFMEISGYKTDIWLVKTVSILLLATSISFLIDTLSNRLNVPITMLALVVAIGMAYVDFYYSLNGTIRKIYMLDDFIEILFTIGWLVVLIKNPAQKRD
jgi:hypothetical protein